MGFTIFGAAAAGRAAGTGGAGTGGACSTTVAGVEMGAAGAAVAERAFKGGNGARAPPPVADFIGGKGFFSAGGLLSVELPGNFIF